MKASIFKAYDIRGLSPGELDAQDAKRIGQAIAKVLKIKHVVVGKDVRSTSDELERELVEGLLSQGVSVTRIGLCSTPLFNFAIGSSKGTYDAGVMVTASHNPPAYNGFKITLGNNIPVGQGNGMEEIRGVAFSPQSIPPADTRGESRKDNTVLQRYIDYVLKEFDAPAEMPKTRIAVDAGNGMDGIVLPEIKKALPNIDWLELYWEPDGGFPNHEANPLKTETLSNLSTKVVQENCLFGAAFDGDGDRVGFVDEKGEVVPGDIMTALLATEILKKYPGARILYDLRSSWSVPETIEKLGGIAEMSRVGHAFIKRSMKETGAVFAGEVSMHLYFKNFWNCESGDYAMLLLLKILLKEQVPFSKLWKSFQLYSHSHELNFSVPDAKSVLKTFASTYKAQATDISHLDGIRMEFRDKKEPEQDWWFSLRASNTEPLVRLNLEAKNDARMNEKKAELIKLIKSLGGTEKL
ncbi:phosphomannomutase/phosphoglucomutase [Candidatus Uhrbacteria bacterium CG22_combo_CG10-13_8_21_14_all_47_17]|uniref:Phosphomannomutase/phosphoglucomutase n=1 Tax=Candidatus Uhrbacteria bacterium CG22_combo_CG10-13_8_21_14_all_47_17 TaxID=1975041 RepID=A0A2H0BS99_9BACT|nr:MAG: phosphomannomutase/phosphoglucomutase [Candidatus Uhrbacteria bacterium CG22_combo_CG10-13_8_21_14_all_47_17]